MPDQPDVDVQFYQLVLSLQAAAMQQMGKIANPITGQIERDLTMTKHTIDMLEMIQRKTAGNLNPDEKRMVEHLLYELRMNFVDELAKDKTGPESSKTDPNSSPNSADNS